MILAAGLGTRLWPLTCDRGKPVVPFLGRPLIVDLAQRLKDEGFSRLVVNTHHQPASIHAALSAYGLSPSLSHEEQILGTGGAIGLALSRGLITSDDPLLIVNGKLFTDIPLAEVWADHSASGAAVTMVLMPNTRREAFREVLTDGDRVTGFGVGRVPAGPSPLLFTGIHVLSPEVLRQIPATPCDTVADIYPPLISAGTVRAAVVEGRRWWEFSTLERYLALHHQAAAEGLSGDVVCSPGAEIHPGAKVSGSVLWESARVEEGAHLENVVLGAHVVVRAGERLANAVVVRAVLTEPGEAGHLWGDRVVVPVHGP